MKRRSGEAMAALGRKAGPMGHRLQPRGGAKNAQDELLAEYEDEMRCADCDGILGECICTRQVAECKVPPVGWWCSREAGHEGPCAARPICGHDQFTFHPPLEVPCPCLEGPGKQCSGLLQFSGTNVKGDAAFLICSVCRCCYASDKEER